MNWGRLLLTGTKIKLSAEQQSRFEMAIKKGILKELHRDKILTDAQLSQLLSDIQRQSTCALDKNTCVFSENTV